MAATDPFFIRRIRTGVITRSAFFGMILGKLILVPDETVETAETDGVYLWYNPTYVKDLYDNDQFEEACGLFAHEAFHAAGNHPLRVGNRELKLANVAADYVDNIEILKANFKLPKGFLYDPQYEGMAWERVYNILDRKREQQKNQQPQQGTQKPQPGQGDDQGQDGGQPQPGQQPGQDDAGQGQGDQPGQNAQGGQQQPNGSGHPSAPGGSFDVGGCGRFVPPRNADGTPMSPTDQSNLKTEWEIFVQHAKMVSERQVGSAPGAAIEIVQEIQESKTDWVDETRRFLRKTCDARYSWLRPDRRFHDIYIPSRMTPRLGDLVLAVDTSGSVTTRQLVIIGGEIRSLVKEINPKRVVIIFCDAAVHDTREYTPEDYDDIDLSYPGRAGTKVQPVFNWVEQQDFAPACMIYFSDLEINDFPVTEPDYPVLWGSVGKQSAPWGEIVMLDQI